MATVEETNVTGRKYRIFDEVNKIWKRVSYWTHASDVEFDDGTNLVDKMDDFKTEVDNTIDDFKDETEQAMQELEDSLIQITLNGNDLATLSFELEGNVLSITTTNK